VLGYCVRCRAKRQMINPTRTLMSNGRRAMLGPCEHCGTKIYLAGSWDEASPAETSDNDGHSAPLDQVQAEQSHETFLIAKPHCSATRIAIGSRFPV